MVIEEVGDWLLWRAKVARMGQWQSVTDNVSMCWLRGEWKEPLDWNAAAWVVKSDREWRLMVGWTVRRGWLPLEGSLACSHRMAGKALWHPRWVGARGVLRRSAKLLTHWQGLPATLPDACYAATLGVEAWSRCGVKARTGHQLLDEWVTRRPLDVRGGTMLGVLECVLNDGMAVAGPLTSQWEFRLARLAVMERRWASRWKIPRQLKEIGG